MHKIRDILKRAGLSGFDYRYDYAHDRHVFTAPETKHGRVHLLVTQADMAQAGSDYACAMLLKERYERLTGEAHASP